MRKGKDYTVYDNDTLTPGYKAKIEHTVYSGSESDLSDLLKLTVGDISALKAGRIRRQKGKEIPDRRLCENLFAFSVS